MYTYTSITLHCAENGRLVSFFFLFLFHDIEKVNDTSQRTGERTERKVQPSLCTDCVTEERIFLLSDFLIENQPRNRETVKSCPFLPDIARQDTPTIIITDDDEILEESQVP
jgi:hypothetical protein